MALHEQAAIVLLLGNRLICRKGFEETLRLLEQVRHEVARIKSA